VTWIKEQIPDQTDRTVIITGANSGIGFEAAKVLAAAGARVVLAVRNLEKGEQASRAIQGRTEVAHLDLADLGSIRSFVDDWSDPVDVLINNAGVMAVPYAQTADGFEMQIGTNHLGHFTLTNLLLPQVSDRVVVLSSGAHRFGHIDLADLNWQSRKYSAWRAYGQSKLANLLFALELQRRLTASGSAVRAMAAHPGYAATNLQGKSEQRIGDAVTRVGNAVLAQSAADGALPSLRAATDDLPGGSYLGPDRRGEQRGRHPTLVGRSPEASDVGLAQELWAASERLTGTAFPTDALSSRP
jgi:NAD(P)-dependent dehydrogenase (short-subunit alcohol dehydrogenase family)